MKSAERTQFLADVLVTAIENYGYGAFTTDKWSIDVDVDADPNAYALVNFEDAPGETVPVQHRVNADTMAHGIQVISDAVLQGGDDEERRLLVNGKTGERLFMGRGQRKAILEASRENDAGELDVIDALAILECALFGKVVYA